MTTSQARMHSRVTFGIENGNVSRFTKYTHEQAAQIATEALEATGYKSLAATRRYLDSKQTYYSF